MKCKGKVIFTVIAALLCMSLFMACPDEGKPADGNKVTIKFDTSVCQASCQCDGTDAGSTVESIKIRKGTCLDDNDITLPTPTKTNHTFVTWVTAEGSPFDKYEIVTKNITLSARWTWTDPNKGAITFDPKNGASTFTRQGEIGKVIADFPADLVWYGWIFGGWFDTQDKKHDKDTVLEKVRITLTAKWTEDPLVPRVTISFNTAGGTPSQIESIRIPSGGTLGVLFPEDPTSAADDFVGWFIGLQKFDRDTIITSITDITLTAKWIKYGAQEDGSWLINHSKFGSGNNSSFANNDTITFTSQWGNRLFDISDMGGLETMNNYKYLIMIFSLTPGINPLTTALYDPPFYFWAAADVEGTAARQTSTLNYSGSTVFVIREENFDFIKSIEGFTRMSFSQGSTSSFSVKISAMMMVNELPDVTVTFDPGSYGTKSDVVIKAGNAIGADNMPADPVRQGYYFNGWVDSITGYPVHENITPGTLIAVPQWIEILNITFKSEGTVFETKQINKGSSFGADFPNNPVSTSGYAFLGWFAEADTDFVNAYTSGTVFNESMTLVAGWLTPDLLAVVTFDLDGGTALNTNPVNIRKNTSLGALFPTPVKPVVDGTKYNFLGWFEGEKQYTAATIIEGNITLKASWQVVQPLVTKLAEGSENDTLFNQVGSWVDSNTKQEKFEYDGKKWWIIGDLRNNPDNTGLYLDGYANPNPAFSSADWERVKAHHAHGYTRLSWGFPTTVNVYNVYTYITVSYEMVMCSASPNKTKNNEGIEDGRYNDIEIRRALNAGGGSVIAGGNSREFLTEGLNSYTRPLTGFYDGASPTNAIAMVKYTPAGSMLVRVTEIKFHN